MRNIFKVGLFNRQDGSVHFMILVSTHCVPLFIAKNQVCTTEISSTFMRGVRTRKRWLPRDMNSEFRTNEYSLEYALALFDAIVSAQK